MRILLTGGTGLIGRALCQRWQGAGHEIVVWSRSPERVASRCAGARGVDRLEAIDGPVDAVVNLAGAPIADRPWTASRRRVLWDSRVALTERLVAWMHTRPTPPERLISGSATGWYGDQGERSLDESTPAGPADFGSELCAAWEQEAMKAQAFGSRVVRLRTAPVLAPAGGMLARLRPPFSLGLGGRLGSGRQWMPWIHLDDAVGLIDRVLQDPVADGPLNLSAPQPVRNADFTRALARALHRPALLPVPGFALKLGLGEMSVLLLGSQRVVPQRAQALGYRFAFPSIETALTDLVARAR